MKAKIKATGEVFRVIELDIDRVFVKTCSDVKMLRIHEVDLISEDVDNDNHKEVDWEQRRYEVAKDIMAAYISNGSCPFHNDEKKLARWSVVAAKVLIKELLTPMEK